jgi:hypothetical protein
MSFELPEPWLSRLHPRRGGAGVRPIEPDPRAREVVDGQMRELPGLLPGVIASEFTEPELSDAATAWCAGDPAATPAGAAAVALAAKTLDWQEHVRRPWFADLWLAERGLRFAAGAAVELFSLILVAEGDRPPRRAIRRDGTETMGVRYRRPGDEHRTVSLFFDPDLLVLLRVRAALAAAPDDLYAEVVEAIAGYRARGPHTRCATSVLVPSRADWVEQDWAEALATPEFHHAAMLLTAIGTPAQAAAARTAAGSLTAGWPGLSATVVDGLGPAAAAGLLLDWFDRVPAARADARRDLLGLLAVLPVDEAMRGLVDRLGQRHVREALIEAAARFPERGLRLLSAPAGKPAVTDLLSVRVRADPALAERVAAGLTAAAGRPAAAHTGQASRIRQCLTGADTAVPAPREALPPLLTDPPWRRRRANPPAVLDLKAPETPTAMAWLPGERNEWLSTPLNPLDSENARPTGGDGRSGGGDGRSGGGGGRTGGGDVHSGGGDLRTCDGDGRTDDDQRVAWEATADRLRRGEPVDWHEAAAFFAAGPEETARPLLAEWRPEPTPGCGPRMRRIVARFEADALLPVRHLASRDAVEAGHLMLPFTSPDIPWRMQVPHQRKETAPVARAWLDRHPGFAAEHLVPRALGPHGPARRAAELTLVSMVAAGHVETLRSVAESYGPEAAAAVETLIASDPTAIVPAKLPAIPKWFDPTLLPPVRLRRPSTSPPSTTATPESTIPPGAELAGPDVLGAALAGSEVGGAGLADSMLRGVEVAGSEAGGAGLAGLNPRGAEVAGSEARGAELAGPIPPGGEASGIETSGAEAAAGGPVLVLPTDVLRDLAMVFALDKPFEPYPGVDVVREVCEPVDLARFAWGLFEALLAAGANGRQGWALDALGLVGDDEIVRRLTPLIMEWPGQSGHARAVTGVGILAGIGTDVALTHLHRIAERSRYPGLRAAAQRRMGEVAEARGLSAEQLADRLVPDFGLDGDGSLTLDYGSRSFAVRFDEELKPCVADGTGKLLKNLPRPGARDDAERASAAYQRFAVLRKDVRAVATDQIRRLERAMVTGRRWPEDEFRRFFAGHPLLRHLTRRLLWGRYDARGALIGGFRVAEDGTFADVHDEVTTIAEVGRVADVHDGAATIAWAARVGGGHDGVTTSAWAARVGGGHDGVTTIARGGEGDVSVGVVHPVHLGETLPLWSEIFADYRIVQPFPQLGREIGVLTGAEAAGAVLTRFEGRRVPSGAVLGLEGRGWRRGTMRDAGTQTSVTPALADALELEFDPGIVLGAVGLFPEQVLGPVRLHRRAATFGDLDPVVVSEVIRDLESLTGSR